MGWVPYITYAGILSLIHHICLVLIEWLQFGDFFYFLGKVAGSTAISLLLILIAELLVPRKEASRAGK
jgi:hypothetical protein